MLPVLTVYVKKQPQELKQVLDLIRDMQLQEKKLNLASRVVPPHLNPATMQRDVDPDSVKLGAKEALEYVSWLANPNMLFDVALTTYDFELVTLVATQTQKDPKEYVPYLQDLKSMDPVYMRFNIQNDLNNYEKALEEISSGDQYFDEALALIKKQRLYKQALALYQGKPQLHAKVKRAFGDYFFQRGYIEEAGFLYMGSEHTEDHEKGLQAFKKCGNVDMCLSLAFKLKFNAGDLQTLKMELIESLSGVHRYKDAGDLLCQTNGYEVQQAVELYNKGNAFMRAIRESTKEPDFDQQGQLLNQTKSAVNLAYDIKKNQILKLLEDFDKRYLRLKIVQHNKRTMQ